MSIYLLLSWIRRTFRQPGRIARRPKVSLLEVVQLEDRITPAYTVSQIRSAYGINSIPDFQSLTGPVTPDGTGQTIAIVDAYDDISLLSDLDLFDQNMKLTPTSSKYLYQQYGAASTFVTVYNQYGVNITADIGDPGDNNPVVPVVDSGWNGEEALDVEWAHAIAPGAKIDFIECNTSGDLFTGETVAASLPGVSEVSNSWGSQEQSSDTSLDSSVFVTPTGHTGVTFLAASGDLGAISTGDTPGSAFSYPSVSPNVVSVGGTHLNMSDDNNGNNYSSESVWSFPTPSETVKYGSASKSGSWTSNSGGFSGTYGTASGGSSSQVSWTLPVDYYYDQGWGGGTEVSVTWTANAANATNAVFSLYDEYDGNTLLGKYTVNEAEAPIGISDNGHMFQELGVVFPELNGEGNGEIKVVLDASSANGTVVADAVGDAQDWAGTGGISEYEEEPAYQDQVQNTGHRTTPDVSFIADSSPGVVVYQDGNPTTVGGTSLACPCWAGLMAIANQGRMSVGGTTFNSPTDQQETQDALYSLPSSDFNVISGGYDGYVPTASYNFATGLGSPIANDLIPDLVSYGLEPSVSGVSPSEGPATGGETVTITGTNFQDVTAVDFGSTAAASFTVVSSTEITAVTPKDLAGGTVDVTVTTLVNTTEDTSADQYTFVVAPAISSLSPSAGTMFGSTTVTITGTNLANATAVDFGSMPAAQIISDTSTQIVVVTPSTATAGTVNVTITTIGGTSAHTSADDFDFVATPAITGIVPDAGPLAGGTTVTITGANLQNATAVDFGSVLATEIISDSSTQIVAVSPIEPASTVDITVTTPLGTSPVTSADQFTFEGIPTVGGVSPDAGPLIGGQLVTITGTNLLFAADVMFGTAVAPVIDSDTNTQLVVTSPANSQGLVDVTVTTAGGTSITSSFDQYTYVPPPGVTAVSPDAGPVTGGVTITITGINLANAAGVDFGTTAGIILDDSDTQLVVTDPGGTPGTVDVTVTTAGGTSTTSSADQYTYVPQPVVTGVAPGSGPAYGGETITITGSNLLNATAVDFGSLAAVITSDSATQIVVTTPADSSPSTVDVTVTTAGGPSATSSADEYTFVPDPVVSALTPSAGPLTVGATVTISGANFGSATAVDFGTVAATIVTDSANYIVVTAPAGVPGTVDVTVTTQFGGASLVSPADEYTFVALPVVSGISPAEGPTSAGALVTITGTYLSNAISVNFGTAAATIESDSATQIVVQAPAGSLGQVGVSVTTAGGTSNVNSAEVYTYVPAPSIEYISITSGTAAGGQTVTFTGSNLGDASAVYFGSLSATIVSDSNIQLVVSTPVSPAGTVAVAAATPGGTATAPSDFTFVAVPVVTAVTPAAGPLAGGTVTITGTTLGSATEVEFGTVAGTILTDSATQLVATAPAEPAGTVNVTVTTQIGGTSSIVTADEYSYLGIPTVSAISPASGPLAGGAAVTITGTNLANATLVSLGGVAGTVVSDSPTQLVVDSPGGTAGTVDITVTTAGGTSAKSAADKFTTTQASPQFTSVDSPEITYGTTTATISGTLDPEAGAYTVPTGETVQITLDGVTQTASLTAGDTFSSTFDTGSLTVSGSPYTITLAYGGDANYKPASSTASSLTVLAATPTFENLSGPTIAYGTASAAVSGTLLGAGDQSIPTGETVQISLDGTANTAQVGSNGGFSTTFNTAALGVGGGPYSVAFAYAGDANFAGATGDSTLTVIALQPAFSNLSAPTITPGTASATVSGTLAASSLAVPAGEIVQITLNGVTQPATIGSGGVFSTTFNTASLAAGSPYSVAFSYAGDGNFESATGNSTLNVTSVDAATSTVSVSSSTVNSGGTLTVTLQAKDSTGANITSGGLSVGFGISGVGTGTFSTVTDNGNGTYSATFTGDLAGSATISATIDDQTVTSTLPSIAVMPGAADAANSLTTLSASTVASSSSITVTVQARDAAGNDLTTGGLTVQVSLFNSSGGQGQFGNVIDNRNGTYTATFTGTTAGANSIVADISDMPAPEQPVTVVPGPVNASNCTVGLAASTVQYGGETTVTLQAVDTYGNDLTTGGDHVTFSVSGPGSVGPVTDNGNGTYSAIVTGAADGTVIVSATIDGNSLGTELSLNVTGNAVSTTKSKLTVSSSKLTAGGATTVTLQAEDAKGDKETAGGLVVVFELGSAKGGQGTFTQAADEGDGIYTATFAGTLAGSNTIKATIAQAKGSPTAPTVKVSAGPLSVAESTVTVSKSTVKAGSSVTLTLQPRDAYGNKLTDPGLSVAITLAAGSTGEGTFGTVKYASGVYTVKFTGTTAGNVSFAATIGGQPVMTPAATATVTAGAASTSKSFVTLAADSVAVGGAVAVTLQTLDADGNNETTGGLAVVFKLGTGSGKGTFGKVTDNKNGTYTVIFTGKTAGANTITATIGGVKLSTAAPSVTVG